MNTEKSIWDVFTNKYKLSKTLRFELRPIGKTKETIKSSGLIDTKWQNGVNTMFGEDATKAEHYKIIKKMLNAMHRLFIEEALSPDHLKENFFSSKTNKAKDDTKKLLTDSYKLWLESKKGDEKSKKSFEDIQVKLAKQLKIALDAKANEWRALCLEFFEKKTDKKSIKIDSKGVSTIVSNTNIFYLLEWKIKTGVIQVEKEGTADTFYSQDEMQDFARTFDQFHTYFSGYNENRANVYHIPSKFSEFITTAISNRLFVENLEFFFSNLQKWEIVKKSLKSNSKGSIGGILKEKDWSFSKIIKELEQNLVKNQFGGTIEKLFQVDAFLTTFSQSGIDLYNQLLGGIPAELEQVKVQGLNEVVNLTRQKAGSDKRHFPVFDQCYKQILSQSNTVFIDEFKTDRELLESLKKFKDDCFESKGRNNISEAKPISRTIFAQLQHEFTLAFSEIQETPELGEEFFLGEKSIQDLSKNICGNYHSIHSLWANHVDGLTKEDLVNTNKKKLAKKKYLSFVEIEKLINDELQVNEKLLKHEWIAEFGKKGSFSIAKYANKKFQILLEQGHSYTNEKTIVKKLSIEGSSRQKRLLNALDSTGSIKIDEKTKEEIKAFLDSCLDLYSFVKSFLVKQKDLNEKQSEKHGASGFLSQIRTLLTEEFDVLLVYNKTRNHLSKKAYENTKIKLNFTQPTLADGWDVNKESANGCVLFKKDNLFYLGIMDKDHKNSFLATSKSDVQAKIKQLEKENKEELQKLGKTKKDSKKIQSIENKISDITAKLKDVNLIINNDSKSSYEKMIYKYFPDASKMIPKCSSQLKEVKKHFQSSDKDFIIDSSVSTKMSKPLKITKEIFLINNEVYDEDLKKFIFKEKGVSGDKKFQVGYLRKTNDKKGHEKALKVWMNFCKDFLLCYESTLLFDYSGLKDVKDYSSLDSFYSDINETGYKIHFDPISDEYIDKLVDEEKLYLFQIYNKDFSKYSKGKPNLHTMYWKGLFEKGNLEDIVLKLNGEAEIFFRPASITDKRKIVHPKGEAIENKNPENKKKNSKFDYDIVKDKRFTNDKFQFHTPITLNFKERDSFNLNTEVQEFLAANSDVKIIGIDRGEKHLLYYSLIDQSGKILEQGSLNTIKSEYADKNGKSTEVTTPYHKLLDAKEGQRDEARKSWQKIENIKELKAGYLSQVVHKLATLIIKHNAIVVLEDLNFGFKRGRIKVEKQVYQKFERALIEKLNYLVFKDYKLGKAGHYLKAFQLTSKFESFQKLGKQTGVLFYTTASYTSKTDPVSGYLQNLYHKYDPVKTKLLFNNFDSIIFNGEYFEFTYDLKEITQIEGEDLPQNTKLTVCSNVLRSKYISKEKGLESFEVNTELCKLFADSNINLEKNSDLKEEIQKQDDKFIHSLFKLFDLILKMRVVDNKQDKGTDQNDYIQSPVYPFYNSKDFSEQNKNVDHPALPTNGDANGAYNIARKGKIILDKITLREKLKTIFKSENMVPDPYFTKITTNLVKVKDKRLLEPVIEEWAGMTGHVYMTGRENESIYTNGKQNKLSKVGTSFVEFVSSLTISKKDWQNYIQRADIVKLQTKKLK